MRAILALSLFFYCAFSANGTSNNASNSFIEEEYVNKSEEVPYFENGKITGFRKIEAKLDSTKTIKAESLKTGQSINRLQTQGFRVAAMDKGAKNPFNLLPSDVLVEVDGIKVKSLSAAQEFFVHSEKYKNIKVLRDGKELMLTQKK